MFNIVLAKKNFKGMKIIAFPDDLSLIAKGKTIPDYKWHPKDKQSNLPNFISRESLQGVYNNPLPYSGSQTLLRQDDYSCHCEIQSSNVIPERLL